MYAERVIPLLSSIQKEKHFLFAEKYLNCWGLGRGKKPLVHYDEKWFWGLVLRSDAKACDSLGLEATVMTAYHSNHINKVMGFYFVSLLSRKTSKVETKQLS